jgi:hypothetical protein
MSVLNFATAAMSDDALAKAKPDDYARLLPLLVALGDAKATAAAAKKLAEKATEADEKIAAADERMVQADRKDAVVQARIDSADELIAQRHAECDKRIADERRVFDEGIAGRLRDLEKREKAAEETHARAVALYGDYERRISLMKEATR